MTETTQGDRVELPDFSDETKERIERAVFAEIADERPRHAVETRTAGVRRRRWVTGIGVAAAFVVGVLVTPPILTSVGGTAMSASDSSETSTSYSADAAPEMLVGSVPENADAARLDTAGASLATDGRDIIAGASATVEVDDIASAAEKIATIAEDRGGYVESTDIGKSAVVYDSSYPAPVDPGYGWISIRVPSSELTATIDDLAGAGAVVSSSLSQQDVTSTAVDLRARVDATKASVLRLTELMAQSGTVSELIEAEVALTDRQAQLESYEQQLASLDDQIAMSSVQVQLTTSAAPTTADPAGFGDGLRAGWNGLIVSLNALVIAIGFILPWVAVAAAVVLVVWMIRRARRVRRSRKDTAPLVEERG